MKMTLSRLLPLLVTALVFAFSPVTAGDVFYDDHPTLWKDADILIWTADKKASVDARQLCLSLQRYNSGIGNPKCREYGEWERDSIAMRYAIWLRENIEPGIPSEYLHARHPSMMAKLQALEDKIVLYLTQKDNQILVAWFDETATVPKVTGSVRPSNDKIALGDDIASTFFSQRTKRRLSREERLKMQTEPDELYREVPKFQAWFGLGVGYSQAQIPFTPESWYKSHTESRIRNYRITKDSVSLWNFLEDTGPVYSVYAGGTWFGFIGMELIYRYANRAMKVDSRDTIYRELDHWDFSQHEIGLSVHLSRTYPIKAWLNISPFAFLGFQYSFFVEDIELKDNVKEPSRAYKVRIEFEDAYKGALIGIGSQFTFFKHYGLGLRTGVSSRGRNIYSDPNPDAAAEPTTIGASTIDWFVSMGLEYHWNL